MVTLSLDALINIDVKTAKKVMEADDEIDTLTFDFRKNAIEGIKANPDRIEDYLHLRTVSKNLERIADQATNIAEDVVYLCTGEIIRHHAAEFNP